MFAGFRSIGKDIRFLGVRVKDTDILKSIEGRKFYLHESIFSLLSSEELSPLAVAGAFETMF